MDALGRRVIDLVRQHPQVRGIRLVGSRATQRARAESDWDFRVETFDFSAVAAALPDLLRPLDPLAEQWDRLSDRQCWMVIVPGPAKIDLIFPEEQHVQEPAIRRGTYPRNDRRGGRYPYQWARDDAERHLGCAITRALASEVAAALIREETK
jgi:predicted nucleotidyltransferase